MSYKVSDLPLIVELCLISDLGKCLSEHIDYVHKDVRLKRALEDLLDDIRGFDCFQKVVEFGLYVIFEAFKVSLKLGSGFRGDHRLKKGISYCD